MTGTLQEVRMAVPQDEEAIMELCRLLHAENGLFSMSETKTRDMIRHALYPETTFIGICGVIGPTGGPLAAMCYMYVGTFWYTEEFHIEEIFNFVHPDFRRVPYGSKMVKFMKTTADRVGLPLVTGILSNTRTEAKCRLYARQLPKAGEYFVYGRTIGQKVA